MPSAWLYGRPVGTKLYIENGEVRYKPTKGSQSDPFGYGDEKTPLFFKIGVAIFILLGTFASVVIGETITKQKKKDKEKAEFMRQCIIDNSEDRCLGLWRWTRE